MGVPILVKKMSTREKFVIAVRNGDIRQVNLYVNEIGILRSCRSRDKICYSLFVYSCLLETKSKQILNTILNGSVLVFDEVYFNFIETHLNKPYLLQILLDFMKSKNYSLVQINTNDINLLSSAIDKRAPLKSFEILRAHGIDTIDDCLSSALQYVMKLQRNEPLSTKILKFLIERGVDVNSGPALQVAIKKIFKGTNSFSMHCNAIIFENIKILLEAGANPNWNNSKKDTILMSAISKPCESSFKMKLLRLLIEYGADVNASNRHGYTPLIYACHAKCCKLDVIDLLIESGANVSTQDANKNNALYHAFMATFDSPDHSKMTTLLRHGADPNVLHHFGNTVLIRVIINMKPIKIYKKEDFDNVAENEETSLVKSFLEHGADPTHVDFKKKSPLMYAVQNRVSIGIIDMLVKAGSDLQIQDDQGDSLLHYAVKDVYQHGPNPLIIKYLLKVGVNPNLVNSEGKTPLMVAAQCMLVDTTNAKSLVKGGADVKIFDELNNTAFRYFFVNSLIPFSKLKFLFEGQEDVLTLINSNQVSVFQLVINLLLKQKKNELHMLVELCKQMTEQNIINISIEIQYLLHEIYLTHLNFNYYFDVLLSSPFKIVNNHILLTTFKLNELAQNQLISMKMPCNFITKLLIKLFKNSSSFTTRQCLHLIGRLENCGFELVPSNSACVSPLTSLLASFHHSTYVMNRYKNHILEVAAYLIDKGVDIQESRFQFQDILSTELHQQFPIPDSLWLALLSGSLECVRLLLPYWSHPPLALLIYVLPCITDPEFYQNCFCPLYSILASGGPLPIGSSIHERVSQLLYERRDFLVDIRSHFISMHLKDGEVPSLSSLCRKSPLFKFPVDSNYLDEVVESMKPLSLE